MAAFVRARHAARRTAWASDEKGSGGRAAVPLPARPARGRRSDAARGGVLGAASGRPRDPELRRRARARHQAASGQDRPADHPVRRALGSRAHGGGRPQHPAPGGATSCSGSPTCRPRSPSTRPSRSPRSSGRPTRAASSTACSIGSCASTDRPPPEAGPPCGTRSCPTSTATSRRCARSSPTRGRGRRRAVPGRHRRLRRRPAGVRRADRRAGRGHRGAATTSTRWPVGWTSSWFNRYARAAAEWTRERLDDDHRDWLGALPLVREIGDATLVHASPAQPDEWDYLVTAEDGFAAFRHFATRWCFVGHSPRAGRCGRSARRDPTTFAAGPRCAVERAGATSSTSAASASRATAIRARRTPCGTWRPGGSSCDVSPTTSTPRAGRSSRPGCRASSPIAWRRAPEAGAARRLGRAALLLGSAWRLALAFPRTDWDWRRGSP